MLNNTFTWNGHSSDEYGIFIERKPNLDRSARKFQTASVPGRNGNIYQLQDAWEEVIVSYEIFAGGPQEGDAVGAFTNVMEWLNSANGYAKLSDTYDSTHYRLGVFVDLTTITSKWHAHGRAIVSFRCRPQRYLVETPAAISSGATISNTTNHNALPLLELVGSGYANLVKVDGRTVVLGIVDYSAAGYFTKIYAGCETEAYRGVGVTPSGNHIPSQNAVPSASLDVGKMVYTVSTADYGVGLPMLVLQNTEYSLSFSVTKSGSSDAVKSTVYFFDQLGQYIGKYNSKSTNYSSGVTITHSFTTPPECGIIMLVVSGATGSTTYTVQNIRLNYGLTAQAYSAYGVTTATVKIKNVTMRIAGPFKNAKIDCENEILWLEGQMVNTAATLVDSDGFPSAEYLHLEPGNNSYTTTNVTSGTLTKNLWEL